MLYKYVVIGQKDIKQVYLQCDEKKQYGVAVTDKISTDVTVHREILSVNLTARSLYTNLYCQLFLSRVSFSDHPKNY